MFSAFDPQCYCLYILLSVAKEEIEPLQISIRNETTARPGVEIYSGQPNVEGQNIFHLLNSSRVLQFIEIERLSGGPITICEIKVFVRGKLILIVLPLLHMRKFFIEHV